MRLNWMSNTYWQSNGYGRYSDGMAHALFNTGIDIQPLLRDHVTMLPWMMERAGVCFDGLTVVCTPPYYLPSYPFPGRGWLLTMTEGGAMPEGWTEYIEGAEIERVIVPCEHNRRVFQQELDIPVHVIPGGTDPAQFPITDPPDNDAYIFLALADRGARKGWIEVWRAFYDVFGTPADTPDVRLIIKSLPESNDLVDRVAPATTDPRIRFWIEETEHPSEIWEKADCVVMPSRSEGWGMPHREAAMMGRPVITTRYSGLDDGFTDCWSLPVDKWRQEKIPLPNDSHINGDWIRADVGQLGSLMRACYDNPAQYRRFGLSAAGWLRENQTWDSAAADFIDLLETYR